MINILCYIQTMAAACYTKVHSWLKTACTQCRQLSLSVAHRQHVQEDIKGSTEKGVKKFTVAIEGNIGCGKSTLLEYFKNNPSCQTLQEPVDTWTNVGGHNALKLLYENPHRWSFAFNNFAMLSRLIVHSSESEAPVKMIERSLHSTRHIFVRNTYNRGEMEGLEFSVLEAWFDYLQALPIAQVDLIVYLRTSPEKCYERMCHRGRKEESSVPLSFVQELHKLHEDWLIERKFPVAAPVLVIDVTPDLDQIQQTYKENTERITFGCG